MKYKKRKVVASIVLLTITIVLCGTPKIYHDNIQRNLTERPVMNTFFGISEGSDVKKILALWNEEWTSAGFTTKVLTLQDAKRHPKFEEVEKIIETHGIGDNASSFYRWLAMSASGGGWMSTFDTFPTKFPMSNDAELPNDGSLTSFQAHVPSLVAGKEDEWDRVIDLMLDAIPRISGEIKSDTHALEVLRDEDSHVIHFYFPPFNVHRGFAYDSPRKVNCETMYKVRAVHISPELVKYAVNNGLYPVKLSEHDTTGFSQRAEAFKIFLMDWKSQCGKNVRPVMHTFFHPVDSMTTAEDKVLDLWKEEWENAGFDTKVLTLDDAKKHPDFTKVEKIMIPLHGSRGYNALCFYRWLAMAASGGGWMSDHDIFPTNFPMNLGSNLPNGGDFASFQSHVPALMSGTAEEWNRVAKLIIDAIPRIQKLLRVEEHIVSDMHAFYVLHLENNDSIAFIPFDMGVQDGYLYDSPRQVNCEKMSVGSAVHLSHALTNQAIIDGVYPIAVTEDDPGGKESRAEGSKIFLDDWRSQCLDKFYRS